VSSGEQAFQNWLASVDRSAPSSGKVDGLPSIPLDQGTPGRTASVVGEPVIKLGADHMDAYNYQDVGTAVRLEAPLEGGQGHPPLAYALYKVEGLAGMRPTLMDIEALPGMLDDFYFVGVADYTTMRWLWFGPYTLPESEIDLRNNNHRFISELGNFYFIVVVHEGNEVTHNQTTLYFGNDGDSRLPAAPYNLQASDGAIADGVGLVWTPGPGWQHFEIFRTLPGQDGSGGANDPAHDWVKIGDAVEPNYFDQAVDVGVVYLYKVRAVNDFGASGFSNVDSGFAGESPPPPEGFSIHGWVRAAGTDGAVGEPFANMEVTLLGLTQPLTIHTGPDGGYMFDRLPQGLFIVVPHDPLTAFDPVYGTAVLGPDHPAAEINFTGRTGELPSWRVWGFVYHFGEDANGVLVFHPMPCVPVTVAPAGDATGEAVTVQTNADGFYVAYELPVGMYTVTPGLDGWRFEPPSQDVHVDHVHVTPMLNFQGFPDGGGGDGCVIEGMITGPDGAGLPEIMVALLPPSDPAGGGSTHTDCHGAFRFAGLAPGKYIVFPQNPQLMFDPRYVVLVLEAGAAGTCEFVGHETDAYYRLWGFAFSMESDAANHFVPLAGVTITARIDGSEHFFTGETNHDGFWEIVEMPVGAYIVSPAMEGYGFEPASTVQGIDGMSVTPALVFQGFNAWV
jgi:hypothetical protein